MRDLQENKVLGKEQRAQPAALFFRYLFLAADPLRHQSAPESVHLPLKERFRLDTQMQIDPVAPLPRWVNNATVQPE